MSDPEFNPGDKVRLVNTQGMKALYGAEGTVGDHPCTWPKYIKVQWTRNGLDKGESHGNYYPHRFEKISDAVEKRPDLGQKMMDARWGKAPVIR